MLSFLLALAAQHPAPPVESQPVPVVSENADTGAELATLRLFFADLEICRKFRLDHAEGNRPISREALGAMGYDKEKREQMWKLCVAFDTGWFAAREQPAKEE